MKTVAETTGRERLMSPREVAEWIGYSEDSVHRFCRDLGLPFRQFGRRKKFARADVQEWLDARKVVAAPAPAEGPATDRPATRPDAGPATDWRREMRLIGKAPRG